MLNNQKIEEVLGAAMGMTRETRKKYIMNLYICEAYGILCDLASDKGEDTEGLEDKMHEHWSIAEEIWLESIV